jgi:hypothetical protein
VDETGALTPAQSVKLSTFLLLARHLPLIFAVMIGLGLLLLLVAIVCCKMGSNNDRDAVNKVHPVEISLSERVKQQPDEPKPRRRTSTNSGEIA